MEQKVDKLDVRQKRVVPKARRQRGKNRLQLAVPTSSHKAPKRVAQRKVPKRVASIHLSDTRVKTSFIQGGLHLGSPCLCS